MSESRRFSVHEVMTGACCMLTVFKEQIVNTNATVVCFGLILCHSVVVRLASLICETALSVLLLKTKLPPVQCECGFM